MIERGLQKLRFLHRGYFKWAAFFAWVELRREI